MFLNIQKVCSHLNLVPVVPLIKTSRGFTFDNQPIENKMKEKWTKTNFCH